MSAPASSSRDRSPLGGPAGLDDGAGTAGGTGPVDAPVSDLAADVAGPEGAPPAQLPALGVRGTLRWAWRQLASMRTALVLLLLLAVATVPGSIFPQRGVDAGAVAAYLADQPELGPWLDRLWLFDVYASPWFAAIYLLLFVSLVGCIVPRSRAHVREWRRRPPSTPRRLERLGAYERRQVAADPAEVRRAARRVLRRGVAGGPLLGYRTVAEPGTAGTEAVAAETGRLRETGNLLFHVSLVAVLAALAYSSLYSYRGEALVVEGDGFSNTLPMYDSITPGARFDPAGLVPFSLTLDRLDVAFEEQDQADFGAPRDFAASVTLTPAPGEPARSEVIRVNQPLPVGGPRVFLSGNGYALVVEVRDAAGEVVHAGPVPFLPQDGLYSSTGVVKVPDTEPQLGLSGIFLPTAVLDDPAAAGTGDPPAADAGPAAAGAPELASSFPDARNPLLVLTGFTGDLGLDDGTPQSVFELDTTDLVQLEEAGEPLRLLLAPGDSAELPGGQTVTFVELRRFAALDIRYDPSGPLALVSSLLALAGLTASLAVPRRRVWVRAVAATPAAAESGGPRTLVEVAGLSRTRDSGLDAEVTRVADQVVEAVDRQTRGVHQ